MKREPSIKSKFSCRPAPGISLVKRETSIKPEPGIKREMSMPTIEPDSDPDSEQPKTNASPNASKKSKKKSKNKEHVKEETPVKREESVQSTTRAGIKRLRDPSPAITVEDGSMADDERPRKKARRKDKKDQRGRRGSSAGG